MAGDHVDGKIVRQLLLNNGPPVRDPLPSKQNDLAYPCHPVSLINALRVLAISIDALVNYQSLLLNPYREGAKISKNLPNINVSFLKLKIGLELHPSFIILLFLDSSF